MYNQRSKAGKAAGVVLLSGGLIIGMASVASGTYNMFSDTQEHNFATGAGMAMVIGSKPVFKLPVKITKSTAALTTG